MPDDSKTYDIVIQTRAAGDGARQTTDELNKTADAAERVAQAGAAQPGGGTSAQIKTANELLEEQRQIQSDIIVAKLKAADTGDSLTVDKLREEIGIRAEILSEIREAGTNVERVNWLIQQQNELILESNASIEAQASATARAAHSLSDVLKIQEGLNNDLVSLYKKRDQAEGEELERLDLQISALEASAHLVDTNWKTAIARKTVEEETKEAIEAQKSAMDGILKAEQKARAEAQLQLELWKELADAKLKADLAQVNADEKQEKISHEEAAKKRAELENANADKTQEKELDKMQGDKASLESRAVALEKARDDTDADFRMARDEAEQASTAAAAKREAMEKQQAAGNADKKARKAEELLHSNNAVRLSGSSGVCTCTGKGATTPSPYHKRQVSEMGRDMMTKDRAMSISLHSRSSVTTGLRTN